MDRKLLNKLENYNVQEIILIYPANLNLINPL